MYDKLSSTITFSDDGDITNNHGERDAWILETDASGNLIWQGCYGGSDIDLANFVVPTLDGNYTFAGYSRSNDGDVSGNHGMHDFWVFKLEGTLSVDEYTAKNIIIYRYHGI